LRSRKLFHIERSEIFHLKSLKIIAIVNISLIRIRLVINIFQLPLLLWLLS